MLERLGIDYFDVFFIHNINVPWLRLAEECNTFEYVKKMKKEGIAKKIGFSFHDDAKLLKEVLDKYGVGYIYDIEAYLSTLETVKRLEAALFIPSHTAPTEDITPLAEYNVKKVLEVCECITDICAEAHTADEIITEVFLRYGITMNFEQYALVGSTVRSYLTYLMDKKAIFPYFNESRLLFERI
jgi:predicted aldo/keto reductase-like oxidoreductase